MSAVQWEDALYLDWIHGLKGNSKLFKLVPFFKSSSLVVLEKDFFHKRKFSILILQLVVLWCPHKDAAYIEERDYSSPPHPQNCFYFVWRDEIILEKLNYFGEVELRDREGLAVLTAEHIANETPFQGQCARMDGTSSCSATLS